MDGFVFPELEAIPSKKDAELHGDVIESIGPPTLNHSGNPARDLSLIPWFDQDG
jgi:hypothetical protein